MRLGCVHDVDSRFALFLSTFQVKDRRLTLGRDRHHLADLHVSADLLRGSTPQWLFVDGLVLYSSGTRWRTGKS